MIVLLPAGRSLFRCQLAYFFYQISHSAARLSPVDLFFGFSVERPDFRAQRDSFGGPIANGDHRSQHDLP